MNSFYWSLFFFSKKKLRLVYQKWRWRWIKWYEGRQVENHDPTVVMFCCPWFVVDLCISSIWNVLSLSKIVGATFSKLDWQCLYGIFRICGRLKTSGLDIFYWNQIENGETFHSKLLFWNCRPKIQKRRVNMLVQPMRQWRVVTCEQHKHRVYPSVL